MMAEASNTTAFYNGISSRMAGYVPVFGEKKEPTSTAGATENKAANSAADAQDEPPSFMGFVKGLIDVINPLQHIPIVGAIYRHITGDDISPAARIAGDTLFGGPIGAAIGLADVAYQKITGQDPGETMIALVTGSKENEKTQVAARAPWSKDIIWDTPAPSQSQPTPPQGPPAPMGAPVPVATTLVPSKMAEALDKYAAMKSAGLAPAPQAFSASF